MIRLSEIRKLDAAKLGALAGEIRETIIDVVSKNGGHLASSLGVVELTLALHHVFNTPTDRIIWDVGHQSYAHKIITGRGAEFASLRKLGGLSGFPKISESPFDTYNTGHSSTSLSLALGEAVGRDLRHEKYKIIPVIGDGSMTGGMAFEALNQAGHLRKNLIVVLNDNEMSISKNVGAFSSFISRKLTGKYYRELKKEMQSLLKGIPAIGGNILHFARKAENSLKGFLTPGTLFEALGFDYVGPIQGHDLSQLIEVFRNCRTAEGPVLIHVMTTKGKGYPPAEQTPDLFHGVGPFDIETGAVKGAKGGASSYTAIFGRTMVKLGEEDDRIIAVTAAMPDGTGLTPFAKAFPDRFFDVGIAEQHALTFSAGLAAEGFRPVAAIYSTFAQRAYDQIFHDICLQKLPVTIALDRGGLVGDDGPTHHGVFDLSFLRHLPEMTVMAPKDENELQHMLKTAVYSGRPIALRYPRGAGYGVAMDDMPISLEIGRGEVLMDGDDLAVIAVGATVYPAVEASRLLAEKGIRATVINARFVKPLDRELILKAASRTGVLLTVEENALAGGFGSAILELLESAGMFDVRVKRIGIPDRFIEHGSQAQLRADLGLDAAGIAASAGELLIRGNTSVPALARIK